MHVAFRRGVFEPAFYFAISLLLLSCSAPTPETMFDWGVIDKIGKSEKSVKPLMPLRGNATRTKPDMIFLWPAHGEMVNAFDLSQPNENAGVDIKLQTGADIRASAAGKVIYLGNELKSYGTLIILSHLNGYATVYARAVTSAVSRGQAVKAGQLIGHSNEQFGGVLHFELRKSTKPLNPIPYLGRR